MKVMSSDEDMISVVIDDTPENVKSTTKEKAAPDVAMEEGPESVEGDTEKVGRTLSGALSESQDGSLGESYGPTDGLPEEKTGADHFQEWNDNRPEGKKIDLEKLPEELANKIKEAQNAEEIEALFKEYAEQNKKQPKERTTVGAYLGNKTANVVAGAIIGLTSGIVESARIVKDEVRRDDPDSLVSARAAVEEVNIKDVSSTIIRGINSRNRDDVVGQRINDINKYVERVNDRGEMMPHDFDILNAYGDNAVNEFKASIDRKRNLPGFPQEGMALEFEAQQLALQKALTSVKQLSTDDDELIAKKKRLDDAVDRQREEAEDIFNHIKEMINRMLSALDRVLGTNLSQKDDDDDESRQQSAMANSGGPR